MTSWPLRNELEKCRYSLAYKLGEEMKTPHRASILKDYLQLRLQLQKTKLTSRSFVFVSTKIIETLESRLNS